jgi:hypothetical protein
MFFLISICSEVFSRMMRVRALYRQLGIDKSITRDAPELLRGVRRSFGGRLVLVNWSAGRVLADTPIPGVSGIAIQRGAVVACSWIDQCVYVLRGREKVCAASHPWFNHLHSIDVTPRGTYLLTSAGSDLIVEIDSDGQVVWAWFGPEHGYDAQPEGLPVFFDRNADYRLMRRATSEQAMHVTSAILLRDDMVLATLFHQGQLIAIDRGSGRASVKLTGLSKPHGIHRRGGGFILSDTLGHRILLLNDKLHCCSEIVHGSQWLQDTIVTTAGTYLTLENVHIDQLPESGLSNRLVELDASGVPLRGVEVEPDYRFFAVCEVDGGFAQDLARAWGSSGDFDALQWVAN